MGRRTRGSKVSYKVAQSVAAALICLATFGWSEAASARDDVTHQQCSPDSRLCFVLRHAPQF